MIKFLFLLLVMCLSQDKVPRQKQQGLSDAFMAYQMGHHNKNQQPLKGNKPGNNMQPQTHQQTNSFNPFMLEMMGMDSSDYLPMMMMGNHFSSKQGNGGGFGGGVFNNPFMFDLMQDNPFMGMMFARRGRQAGRNPSPQALTDAAILDFLNTIKSNVTDVPTTPTTQKGPTGSQLGPMLFGDLSPKELLFMKMMSQQNSHATGATGGASGGLTPFQKMMFLSDGLSDAMAMSMFSNQMSGHGSGGAMGGIQQMMLLDGVSDAMKMQILMNQGHGGRKQANPANETLDAVNSTATGGPSAEAAQQPNSEQNGGNFDPSIYSGSNQKDFLAYQALNGKLNPSVLSQLINGEFQESAAANNMMPNGASPTNPFAGATGAVSDLVQDAANLAVFEKAGITNPSIMKEAFEGQYLQTKTFSDLVKKGVAPSMAADLSKSKIQQYKTLAGMQKPGVANPWVMKEIVDGEFLKYSVVDALVKAGLGRANAESLSENKQLQFQVVNKMVKQGQIDPSIWGTIMEGEFAKMQQKQQTADLINAALANHGLPTSQATAGITDPTAPRKSIIDNLAAMEFVQQQMQQNAAGTGGIGSGGAAAAFNPLKSSLVGMGTESLQELAQTLAVNNAMKRISSGGAGAFNPMKSVLAGMGTESLQELAQTLAIQNAMKKFSGGAAGTNNANTEVFGGFNPTAMLNGGELGSSDYLAMMMMNQNKAAPQHGRGQSWMGSQGGSGSMLNNWLMAEALSDLGLQPMEYAILMSSLDNTHTGAHRRGAPQFLPGMGMGMNPQMMGGMGGGNPMQNMFMMDALSGGDFFNNDIAQDYGNMMMMQKMMQPQHNMMNPMGGMGPMGGGMHYAYPAQTAQYYHPVSPTSAEAAHVSPSSASFSSGKRPRGSLYDNYWEMNMLQDLLNPSTPPPATGAKKGEPAATTPNQNAMDLNNLAALEMALGDSVTAITPDGTGASPAPAANEVVVESARIQN